MEVSPVQNPNRYIRTNDGWLVSSVSDSPDGNINGEIVPITIPIGKAIPNSSIYTVLEVDGIVIQRENCQRCQFCDGYHPRKIVAGKM